MLNDWCEMPDDADNGAVSRAALEASRDASAAAVTTVEGGEAGSSPAPGEDDRQADRGAPTDAPITIAEADLLYWFG
jgi:hypothetical protein